MPNWTEQTLHLVGPTVELDRFIRVGYTRKGREQFDNLLHFDRLCPLKRGEAKDTYTHDSGVVLIHFRTRTQALFSMITSWDYPAEFYARLAKHWPTLSFVCAVNGEMGDFGGIIMSIEGRTVNLVRDYDDDYVRRPHARQIARALREWGTFLTRGRDYRLLADEPWNHPSLHCDAHFDDDLWFYFSSREDVARFRARYKSRFVMRRTEDGWRKVRIPSSS